MPNLTWLRMSAAVAGVGAVLLGGPGVAMAAPVESTETTDTHDVADTSATAPEKPETPTADTPDTDTAADAQTDPATAPSGSPGEDAADDSAGDTTEADETPQDLPDTPDVDTHDADPADVPPIDDSSTHTDNLAPERGQHSSADNDSVRTRPDSSEDDAESARADARRLIDTGVAAEPVSAPSAVAVVSVGSDSPAPATDTGSAVERTSPQKPRVTVKSMVTDVLTWIGLGSLAKGLPIPALPVPAMIQAWWLNVRERQYLHNNQRPVADPTVSGQGPGGVITGTLNATDYDDANLHYVVAAGPQRGTVVVDAAGRFTYTPDAATAVSGGTDRFTIAIDDTTHNPAHVHGLLGLLGLAKPITKTITVSVAPGSVSTASTAGTNPDLARLLSRDDLTVSMNADGTVGVIDGTFTDALVRTAADAAGVLNSVAPLLGASAGFALRDDITHQSVGTAADTVENFYRLSQRVDGIPVLGSEVILAVTGNGAVTGLFNNLMHVPSGIDMTLDAAVDEGTEVRRIASAAYLGATRDWQPDPDALAAFDASTWFRDDLVVYALNDAPSLAWRVVVVPVTDPEREPEPGNTFLIRANGADAGQVLLQVSNLDNLAVTATDSLGKARTINVRATTSFFFFKSYALIDDVRKVQTYKTSYGLWGMGAPILPGSIITSRRPSWAPDAVSAHANAEAVYDFYRDVLGLTSFDGNRATVRVSIGYNPRLTWLDYVSTYNNAFWDPDRQQFVFGNGGNLGAALDVVGHEFTHAVVSHVIGNGGSVLYWGEPGAVNEAYADILGSLAEGKSDSGRWLLAEDSTFPGGPLRNLADPSTIMTSVGPYREHYAKRYTGAGDDGGEHVNSTIFSHAAYKMMTNPATSAISTNQWAQVFYRSLYRLSPSATFADGRAAVVSSARALGFSDTQVNAIETAFNQVGIVTTTGASGLAA